MSCNTLFQVRLSMNPSTQYSLDTRSKQNVKTCVWGQDTATRSFTIVFNEIGNINVSISVSHSYLKVYCLNSFCQANAIANKI